jgi:hypothetical protein
MGSEKRNAWDEEARIELVLALLGGETTVAQAGEQHGLDPCEIEAWKALYVGGLRHAARASEPSVFRRLGRSARRHPLRACGAGAGRAAGALGAPGRPVAEPGGLHGRGQPRAVSVLRRGARRG